MTPVFADIFAILCGVAGWFYLFYSKAASRLAGMETPSHLAMRIRLRRICGGALILLGTSVYAGSNAINDQTSPGLYLGTWMGVMLLLLIVVSLAAADLYLTRLLHRKLREKPRHDA
jgi:hypothetical protein